MLIKEDMSIILLCMIFFSPIVFIFLLKMRFKWIGYYNNLIFINHNIARCLNFFKWIPPVRSVIGNEIVPDLTIYVSWILRGVKVVITVKYKNKSVLTIHSWMVYVVYTPVIILYRVYFIICVQIIINKNI